MDTTPRPESFPSGGDSGRLCSHLLISLGLICILQIIMGRPWFGDMWLPKVLGIRLPKPLATMQPPLASVPLLPLPLPPSPDREGAASAMNSTRAQPHQPHYQWKVLLDSNEQSRVASCCSWHLCPAMCHRAGESGRLPPLTLFSRLSTL